MISRHLARRSFCFNPLPIGAVFPTIVIVVAGQSHIKFQSPTNRGSLSDSSQLTSVASLLLRFQSPTNRGSLSDETICTVSWIVLLLRFNPLPIGAVFPTYRPLRPARVRYRFNPLPIGAVFPTNATPVVMASTTTRFNPLPIGAVFPTELALDPRVGRPRRFNPLPIGAVFPTRAPHYTGQFVPTAFQSPTNRGSLSDSCRWRRGEEG